MTTRRTLFAVSLLGFGAACATPGPSDDEGLPTDLAAAAAAFDHAQIAGDRAELDRLVADDYVLIGSDGALQNKAQFIADFTSPNFRIEPFNVEEPIARFMGESAVLAGRVLLHGTSSGNAFTLNLRFSDVWVKRGGAWQVLFAQTTRVAA